MALGLPMREHPIRYQFAQGELATPEPGDRGALVESERPDWLSEVEGVLETLNQGVVIADDCHRMIHANDVFLEMTGRRMEEILGRTSTEMFPPEDLPILNEHIAMGDSTGRNRFEFYLPLRDGSRLPVVVSAKRVEDPDGREFAIITFTDITEQKRAENKLRDANTLLETRQREIDEELVLASRVQQSLAPKSLHWGDLTVEAHYQPVRTIGGDFGLVIPSDTGYLNLLVCDVSGHGISSALVANRIYTETMSQIEQGTGLASMLRHLNHFVIHNIGSSVFFFTLAAARINSADRSLEFVGAGHPPAFVVRPGEKLRHLESRSLVLGFLEDAVSGEATIEVPLRAGDRVVLYTDGLTDNFNSKREMLGVDGLAEIVDQASALPLPQMKQTILDRVSEYREGPSQDDVSLVLAEVS
jgi:PAS domain S-box-containing protein